MRLIDADVFFAEIKKRQEECKEWMNRIHTDEAYFLTKGTISAFYDVKRILDKMPIVLPNMAQVLAYECGKAERKYGRWVEEPNCTYRCSQCGEHYQSIRGYMYHNFCPNCGADMRGEANDSL